MIHDLTRKLIDRIHMQTEAGDVDWVEGPTKNSFSFEADNFQVSVEASAATLSLVIADTEGRELESLGEDELSSTTNSRGDDYETVVRSIHQSARRVALGTDHAIQRILDAMDE